MSRPRYPLQAVLDQRRRAKDEAQHALAGAISALAREEQLLREKERARAVLEADREEHRSHLYDPDEAGLLPIALIEKRSEGLRYLDGKIEEADREVAAQKEAVARAEASLEGARARLVEAEQALKAVEKHHETWLADWKREMSRKDQRQTEEVVLARFAAEAAGDDRPE